MTEVELVAPNLHMPDYSYRCNVVKVVDADTIDVDIDVGFKILVHKRLRLYGVNAWETRGAEREKGLEAKAAVQRLLIDDSTAEIHIQTLMDAEGKYGRLLAWVFVLHPELWNGVVCLNTWLIGMGHGRPYMINKG